MSDLKVDGVIASTGTNTNLTLQGKGSGKVAIGDGALLFPDADGSANQVIETNASGVLSFVTPSAGGFTKLTEQATTSGTTKDFTVPTTAKVIIINLLGTSVAGTDDHLIQLGDSGGIETSAYFQLATTINSFTSVIHTDGFCFADASAPHRNHFGSIRLSLEDASAFTWIMGGGCISVDGSNGLYLYGGGHKSLSAAITTVRYTTVGGATFDAGALSVLYSE